MICCVAVSGCVGAAAATPEPTGLTHYSAGEHGVSFDYPAGWRVIAENQYGGVVQQDIVVLGTGSWSDGCTVGANSANCTGEKLTVAPGQIVVRVYRDHQFGPVVMCDPAPTANSTLGAVVARVTGSSTDRIWEIREPNTPYFGAQNNLWVEARSDDPAQMAKAEALVASLKQADNGITGPGCYSADPSGQ